jgi:hypothetical protein
VCASSGRLVLNGGGEVIPMMGMNKVWRTWRLVMLSVVPWLTTIRYIVAMWIIATKRMGWHVVYGPVPQLPVARGVVDGTTVT